MDVGAGVTVSDGPATDLVLVGGKSKAFELLGHGEARGAVGETQHGNAPLVDFEVRSEVRLMYSYQL
jgi:hypothetical protein